MIWYGADPGGKGNFGFAELREDGAFRTCCLSSVEDVLLRIIAPTGLGIDAPLWWSPKSGGGRAADNWVRCLPRVKSGTVQTTNSLRGAAVVQGVLLATLVRRKYRRLQITESHPTALMTARRLTRDKVRKIFHLKHEVPTNAHQRDALICAIASREGYLKNWTQDLAAERPAFEIDAHPALTHRIHYWWPREGEIGQ